MQKKQRIRNITFIILLFVFQVSFSQNTINLKLNLHKGDEYIATTKLHSTSEQEVNGEKQVVKKEIKKQYKLKILQKSDSTFYIKLTYLKFHNTFYFNDEIIVFDSDSIKKQNLQQQDSSFLNIGKSFNLKISEYGNIILIDSVSFIKTNKKNLKKIIEAFFIPLTKQNISINDSWTSKDTIKEDIFNIYNKKYTFTENTDSIFIIENFALLNSDKTKFKKARDLFIFYNISGNEKGIIILDKNTCMLKEKNTIQASSGISEVKYSKDSGIIFSSPLKIENIISTQIIKINNNEN